MKTLTELEANVKAAEENLFLANKELSEFETSPENNVFESLADAESVIEDRLLARAENDCEIAGECGFDEYLQEFIVDGQHYIGTLSVEYNRHDKRYYYVEEYKFRFDAK